MRTTIPWGDGTGDNIYLDYNASAGDQSVSVSSDANAGVARTKVVTFSASGATPVTLTVNQAVRTKKQVTISAHPTSYDTEHYAWDSIVSGYPIENGYTDSDSTTQARFNWVKGDQAETYIYYKFDFSSIPADADIISVTGMAKGYVNTATSGWVAAREIQFATGTTLKGTAEQLTSTVTEFTFTDVGSWTRAELQNAAVRFYVRRNASGANSTFYMRTYGATMTVTYEYYE